jgi:hypothetical protein
MVRVTVALSCSLAVACSPRPPASVPGPPAQPASPEPAPDTSSFAPPQGYRSVGDARLPIRKRSVGTNLAVNEYWSDAFPFVDAMKAAQPWFSGHEGTWDDGRTIDVDALGNVQRLAPGQIARSYLLAEGTHHTGGRFVVLYQGAGTLDYRGGVSAVSRGPGRDEVDVSPGGALWLELSRTEPGDPLRSLRVLFPGGSCADDQLRSCLSDYDCQRAPHAGTCVPFEKSHGERPFSPTFLSEVAPFSVLRFMDWQNTNRERGEAYPPKRSLEALPTRASTFWRPVPVEVMVQLANTLDADPWFCMPNEAEDPFVQAFAERVSSQLREQRNVYVEYTNEYWNDIFGQHQAINAAGCQRFAKNPRAECGTGGGALCSYTPWSATQERCLGYGRRQFSTRTVEVGAIFRKAFGARAEHVQRVMAGQVGGAGWWVPELLEAEVHGAPAGSQVDVMAVAPYFGGELESAAETFAQRAAPAGIGRAGLVDRVLCGAEGHEADSAVGRIRTDLDQLAALPEGRRPRYAAYEGGQHFFSHDPGVMDAFVNLNRDPRMEWVYTRYLGLWHDLTADALFVHFSSPGNFSRHGAWGAKEFQGQPDAAAPKYRALLRYVAGD